MDVDATETIIAPADPSTARPVLAIAAAIALGAVGAVIMGEQPLSGVTVIVAAVLLGMAVAEVVVSLARYGDRYLAASAALVTEASMVWALYIETGHRLDLAATEAWVATAGGAALAAGWLRSAAQRGDRSPTAP